MESPFFSVIITTVDRPKLLEDAVSSVLGQTFTDLELIVVNDGGPDITARIVAMDPLSRVRVLDLPGRSGPGKARNQGTSAACGKYICFLDDDDLYYPQHLQTLADAISEHPDAVVYSDAVVCREHIDENNVRQVGERAMPWQHRLFIRQRLWMHNFIPVQTFAVKREALDEIGGFDESLRAYEDWDLLLRLAVGNTFFHVEQVTSEIRMRPKTGNHRSHSVRADNSEGNIIESIYAQHGDLDDPLVRAGRDYLRRNNYSCGPDYLIIDADDADIAYRNWREAHCRDEAASSSHDGARLRLIVYVPIGHERWVQETRAATEALPDEVAVTFIAVDTQLSTEIARTLQESAEDWIALVPAGTTLAPNIATLLATAHASNPKAVAIYFDHDSVLLPQGIHARLSAKPDFDPELLAGTDYIGPALCITRQQALRHLTAECLSLPAETIFHDMLWRLFEEAGGDAIAHVPFPAVHLPLGREIAPLAALARQALVEQHFYRSGERAVVAPGAHPGSLRIEHEIIPPKRTSIILWGNGDIANMIRCVVSLAATAFSGEIELLPACDTAANLDALRDELPGLILHSPMIAGSSMSERRNSAALAATGDIIVFLRDTTEIVPADWLHELATNAARDGIAATAPKLVGDNGLISGGAYRRTVDGQPEILYAGTRFDAAGEAGQLTLPQTVPALSGHCLAIRRTTFLAAGGFAADDYPDEGADIDLCLRLERSGLRNLWLPQVVVADHVPAQLTDSVCERLAGKACVAVTRPNAPEVTILFWSDNRADLLPASLDALLAQQSVDFRIIVLDNASIDASREILQLYEHHYVDRLRVVALNERTTRSAAEYEHRELASGKYVSFAAAGSISLPERLAAAVEQLRAVPNLGAVCSKVAYENAPGVPAKSPVPTAINEGDCNLRRRLLREGNVIDTDTVTMRGEIFRRQHYNPALAECAPLPLWLDILDSAEILRIDEVLVQHRGQPDAPPTPSLAARMQTVAAIAAVFRRWQPGQFFHFSTPDGSAERTVETAVAEAQIALQLVELDRRFLGYASLGCDEALQHALTANSLAPMCLEAQLALRYVQSCLGDAQDAPEADRTRPPLPPPPSETEQRLRNDYRKWREKRALREVDGEYFAEHMVRHWRLRPEFTVISPDADGESIEMQLYAPRRTVSGADIGETLIALTSEAHSATNNAAQWVIVLPHGARLFPEALMRIGDAIACSPETMLWYADDELAGSNGPSPRFKPDFDPLLLSGNDYPGVIAISLTALSALTPQTLGAGDTHRLTQAIASHFGRNTIGHLADVLFFGLKEPLPPSPPAFALPTPAPSVSLMVVAGLRPVDASTLERLLASTDYPAAEVIICGKCDPAIGALGIKIVDERMDEGFAVVANRAATLASGDYLMLVGADSVPLAPDWLTCAVALASNGGYGAVGCAGRRADGVSPWGSGIIGGVGGGFDEMIDDLCSPPRTTLPHECLALRADGLLCERQRFIECGGFDPQWLQCTAIAVDFCLRLRERGGLCAWTPTAVLARSTPDLTEPEAPIDELLAARDGFIERWKNVLATDRYWNRNLSLQSPSANIETDLVARWTPAFHDRLRILALPMPASGQAAYRVTEPLRALDDAGLAQMLFACEPIPGCERAPTPIELARLAPDVLYLQAAFDDVRFAGLLAAARFNPEIFRVFSLDDRVSDMPAYNASSKALPRDLVMARMRSALAACNRLVVSTEPLADLYREQIDDIVVVPNRLTKKRWQALPPTNEDGRKSRRPRVGWAGALQHAGDLAIIREVVHELAGEVDWIFFGMIPAGCETCIREFHAAVHLDAYPGKLASLALDLALAPLEINLFNEAKSNLRLLEYGVFGWPVICTDIFPFRANAAPVCRVQNKATHWIAAIREHLADRDALRHRGNELRAWVERHYLLEDHLDDWRMALTPR